MPEPHTRHTQTRALSMLRQRMLARASLHTCRDRVVELVAQLDAEKAKTGQVQETLAAAKRSLAAANKSKQALHSELRRARSQLKRCGGTQTRVRACGSTCSEADALCAQQASEGSCDGRGRGESREACSNVAVVRGWLSCLILVATTCSPVVCLVYRSSRTADLSVLRRLNHTPAQLVQLRHQAFEIRKAYAFSPLASPRRGPIPTLTPARVAVWLCACACMHPSECARMRRAWEKEQSQRLQEQARLHKLTTLVDAQNAEIEKVLSDYAAANALKKSLAAMFDR